jgi:hypothetical protein
MRFEALRVMRMNVYSARAGSVLTCTHDYRARRQNGRSDKLRTDVVSLLAVGAKIGVKNYSS